VEAAKVSKEFLEGIVAGITLTGLVTLAVLYLKRWFGGTFL
jgi:hypothetical protein